MVLKAVIIMTTHCADHISLLWHCRPHLRVAQKASFNVNDWWHVLQPRVTVHIVLSNAQVGSVKPVTSVLYNPEQDKMCNFDIKMNYSTLPLRLRHCGYFASRISLSVESKLLSNVSESSAFDV